MTSLIALRSYRVFLVALLAAAAHVAYHFVELVSELDEHRVTAVRLPAKAGVFAVCACAECH